MKNLLSRGGIEIIAVFIGISGGLWSEKQIELKNTLKSEKVALKSIREQFISDSTALTFVIESVENEQKSFENLLEHIKRDTTLTEKSLNSTIKDIIFFSYFTEDKSAYESLIEAAGKKIIQSDSLARNISSVYSTSYKNLEDVFKVQSDILALKTYESFVDAGGYLDSKNFSITESLNQDQKKMFNKVFSDNKFITQLVFHYDTNFFVIRRYELAVKKLRYVINEIDNYLESEA
tara:strand:+ start:678 stop:1382 length:705 start_codon:yes stop_codon:yes gene_type:complete